MNAADVNLYLVGFMGTGKTTVGRAVAQRLGFDFIDSDHEIERLTGKTIPDIFEAEGEAKFRVLERDFISEGHPSTRTVVACGGGLVVQPGMPELLRQKGVVICLHASAETILERTSRQANRPLLETGDRSERVRSLLAEREAAYRSAGSMISTEGRPLRDIVAHVVRVWQREAAELARKA